ncbi:hypothetical protein AMTR_s00027p00151400 [Amborella trichopoda]|uniref:Uncharacterized protein n=1 Tax=Amborella trichopoda TaxID=13333 RepID=W1PSD7_AMBTC|nr:hypothetical protein AMTR_s00027p00151400 [Amborella trichopoda]
MWSTQLWYVETSFCFQGYPLVPSVFKEWRSTSVELLELALLLTSMSMIGVLDIVKLHVNFKWFKELVEFFNHANNTFFLLINEVTFVLEELASLLSLRLTRTPYYPPTGNDDCIAIGKRLFGPRVKWVDLESLVEGMDNVPQEGIMRTFLFCLIGFVLFLTGINMVSSTDLLYLTFREHNEVTIVLVVLADIFSGLYN